MSGRTTIPRVPGPPRPPSAGTSGLTGGVPPVVQPAVQPSVPQGQNPVFNPQPAVPQGQNPVSNPQPAAPVPLHQQSFLSLIEQRNALPRNDPQHAVLGPAEHRAFAREWTQEQPLRAVPSLLAGIPAYTGAKALGLTKARSPASLNEMAEAYRGMWEGLASLPPFRRTR